MEGAIEAPKEIVMVLDNSGTFNSYIKNVPWPLDYGIYAHDTLSSGRIRCKYKRKYIFKRLCMYIHTALGLLKNAHHFPPLLQARKLM